MKPSSSISETLFTGWYSQKKKLWRKLIVLLVIESFMFGQVRWSWAQESNQLGEAPDIPEIEVPDSMYYGQEDDQPTQSPFMPTLQPFFEVGAEDPFFDSDNDSVPGSDSEDTGYGLEDIISVDGSLRMDLSDMSQLPRYKLTFTIEDGTTFINIGFDETIFENKAGGGYLYSEKVLSLKTKDGNLQLSYDYYTIDDGVEDEGSMDNDAVVGYQYGVEYAVEFQVTLSNIKVYVYEASQERPDDPSFTVEGFESPVFYAVNNNNSANSLSLEVYKRVSTGYEPVDLNNDGITDAYYDSTTGIWGIDVDNDGIPDGQGIDTDNDGQPDQFRFDQDRDGTADGDAQDFNIDFDTGEFDVDIPEQDRTVITADGELVIYDIDGNELSRSGGGYSITTEYLPDGSRRVTTNNADGVTTQVFDENDRLTQQTVQERIDDVLETPGERTGFLYDNDTDPNNPGGEIRSQYTDNNGNGVKDGDDEFITVAVLDSDQDMVSITYYDSPRDGDLTIQKFQENGNLESITVDESVEHGDGWTIQIFDVNGYLQNITDHDGLTDDEVIQRYAANGRILTQTDYDNDTAESTIHYFSYKTDPDHIGWQVRTERIDDEFNGDKNSIARLDSNNALINVSMLRNSDENDIETLIEYNVPEEGYTTYHSYNENDDGEMKQVYDSLSQITLQQEIDENSVILESIVYQYEQDGDNKLRVGYIDTDKNGVRDAGEDLVNSIAEFDNYGDLTSQTTFENDGVTADTVIEFNQPQYGWTTYRMLNQPEGKATIQIVDYENNMRALMTLNDPWAEYTNSDNVEESVVYEYDSQYRWGYQDTDRDGAKDAEETLLDSVAEFDNEGDFVSITSYETDGVTIASVTTFDWPVEGYQVTRILDAAGDTIQISDADNQLVAMMTLNEMWDDYDDPNDVEESVVYVSDTQYRWGYVDIDKDAIHDAGTETLLDSVAEFDGNGEYISITNYESDGTTISMVTTFDWPVEGYQVTRVLDAAGDSIQISNADNQMVAMMTLNEMWDDYDDPNDVEESVVYVYDGLVRWGYVDIDKDAIHDAGTETLLDSVAEFDGNGEYISITNYDDDGTTISSVTTFDWPVEGYQVTRIVNDPAGKDTIQISDADNQLVAMMTLNASWGDYTDSDDVDESTVYTYSQAGDNQMRVGYVDTNKDAVHDATELDLASVMVFDNDGDVISITGYLADGQTMSYIVTYDEPQEDWSTQRSINSPFTRDTLTIFDNEGLVRATQTTEGTLLDGPPESETITESTVYVYDDTVRWGYMDVAKNGLYESENDTVLENKVQYDTNGSVLSATYWSYDEETQTSSLYRVDEYNKEFGVDHEGYVTTTLYNYPGAGDMQIQVSNPDGELTKKREWDNDTQSWTYIVYTYYTDTERYGFIDLDNDGVGDQLESRAKFDANDNLISNTVLFRSGGSYWNQGEIQYITVYNYDGTIATSYNKTPQEGAADGDFATYQYNREGTLTRIDQYDISANKMTADYYMSGLLILTEIYAITVNGNPPVSTGNVTVGELLETIERNSQVLPDGRTRITNPDTGLVQVYDSEGNLVETTDNQKVVNIYYYDNDGNYVREDNLGYKIVWYGDPTDPETTYTTFYNEMNSITTYSFIVPLGRGNDWRMIQTEYWADGLVIERDYETQDITSISRYERDTNGDLITETIIYQHKVKTVTEMNWPESGWRAVLIPGGAENDNDAVMIVDEANKLRGYMEILKSSSYKSTSNIILSVVYDYDTSGNRIGYVDTDKDGMWDEATETTQYSYTETWSVDDTKEVTRIFDAGGDIIEIRDATFNGKLRARMVLTGTGLSYDYNNPSHVATSNLYLYNADGTWDVYVENSNKNGVYDGDGSEADTGYDGAPNYRSSNGALMQVLDNEGNIISNTFGSGYMVNYLYDNDGTYQGSNETKYYGSTYYYDNEGNPYPEGIIDYHGNYIHVDSTSGSYIKQYKEFETDGTYTGTYNVYDSGLLITQVNSQGQLTYKKYTSSGGETVTVNTLTTNADRVDITNASDPEDIDAQILSGTYYEWYDTGTTSLVIDYDSGSGAFLSCVRTTGAYEKQILLNGASAMMYESGYTSSNTAEEISNGYGIGFMRVSADGGTPQYIYYTQEGTPMVQQIGGGNLSTVDLGTTPTNTVDLTQVYKWTEDGGTTTVYRFNGINRYFDSSGVLQKTVWSDSSGNVQRTMNYGAHQGNGFYIVNSIVDADGLTCTVNRSGSTITGYDLTLASGTDATVDAAGQMTSVSIAGHTQTYDSSGNLTSMTTDDGLVMLSSNGEVSSITDVDGTTMTYHWSGGTLTSFEISDTTLGMTRDYEIQSGYLRLSSVTESSGRLTEYYYDTSGSIRTYSDASPSSYSVIVTEGDTTYGYGYRPDGGIPGLYLYYVSSPDYTLTYTRHSTYPYYILSQQLVIDGPDDNDVTLEFYGSSWKTGGNYEYGDLYYISGSRFGTEYAIKNP